MLQKQSDKSSVYTQSGFYETYSKDELNDFLSNEKPDIWNVSTRVNIEDIGKIIYVLKWVKIYKTQVMA